MFEAAVIDGQNPYLRSGFRSIGMQDNLFKSNVEQKMASDGISYDEAAELVNKSSSRGGYSEHNTGLAVDVMDQNLPGYAPGDSRGWDAALQNGDKGLYGWFKGNAHKYGFVISYPTGGKSIYDAKDGSGYPSAEPWHLKYVGPELATYLYDQNYLNPNNNLALDSFLKDLSKNTVDPNLIAMK